MSRTTRPTTTTATRQDQRLAPMVERCLRNGPRLRRSYRVDGRRQAVRLGAGLWSVLDSIAKTMDVTTGMIVEQVAMHRPPTTALPSALRVFILAYCRQD